MTTTRQRKSRGNCSRRLQLAAAALLATLPAMEGFTLSANARLSMSAQQPQGGLSRRDAIIKSANGLAVGAALLAGAPAPSLASLSSVNDKLRGYGLPPIETPPKGMNPVLEIYGRDENRETILVGWNYPRTWIVERPNMDTNYEDGTVSTGDYQKGDTAFLYVGEKELMENDSLNKESAANIIQKAISQKGDNQYQSFKLKSLKEGGKGRGSQKYFLAAFSYELLTGAGFTVDRVGNAAITQLGGNTQAVVAATTSKRYKKLQPEMEEIARSFRVYDGIPKRMVQNQRR